ncbi:MAG TPA: beta-propeller domain-containing protein, partial [Gammaproteobacteria bacterium]
MQNTTGSFGCKKSACKTLPAVLLAVTLAACGQSTKTNEIQNPKPLTVPLGLLQLQPADNCDELKNYITESIIKEYASIPKYAHYYYCPAPGGGGDAGPAPPASGAAPDQGGESNASDGSGSEGSAAAATPGDVSDTNNQEQGVHEGDIVKADDAGNVYILTGRYFIVADGFPPQNMSEHTRIDLGARGLNLFLDKVNQRVIILARHDEPYYIMTPAVVDESSTVVYPKPEQDYTAVIFYDVSDPANPVVIDQLQLRGYFREGRNIDNRLHLVSNHYLRPLGLYEDAQFWELYNTFNNAVYQTRCDNPQADLATHPAVVSARNNLVARITAIVSSQDPSAYLPDALRINNAGASEPIAYLACTDIQFPAVNMSLGLQIITSVDSDGANLAAAGIVNNSYITYVSQDHLYLAEPSRSWWWEMDDGRRLSSQTAIYKFAISGNTPQYVATGRVDGYVLNQFSFSEYNGALRVATTQNDVFQVSENQWQLVQSNHLSVLTDDGSGALTIAGEVRDFAPNETIRSARFFGEKGFVVTFRNVDPLFTFDLADPSHPVLIGELTIPGFSTYMHAYDDNHLLTIGPSGGEGGTGTGAGVQLQLIDVSDMTNPRVRHSYLPTMPGGWSWSEAEYDHKAFTFYKPANLLAIPLQISPSYSNDVFSGIAAYEVTLADGFRELGRVDHADLAYEYYCVANSAMLAAPYIEDCRNGWYVQWAAPRRSIVMTDESDVYLYTVSDVGLKASSINDLSSTLGSLVFPP